MVAKFPGSEEDDSALFWTVVALIFIAVTCLACMCGAALRSS